MLLVCAYPLCRRRALSSDLAVKKKEGYNVPVAVW